MLKVECDSCKAPYQVDERRVPPGGLKMRCPKCGHSFQVTLPGGPASAASPGPVRTAGATRASPPPTRLPPVSPPQKTMLGLSPSEPPPAEPSTRSSLPSDFPAALGFLDERDLPVVSPDLPAAKALPKGRPASFSAEQSAAVTVPQMPATRLPRPAPVQQPFSDEPSPFGDVELALPTPLADLPAARPAGPRTVLRATKPTDNDLPVPSAQLPIASAGLPSLASPLPARSAAAAAYLPAPVSSLPVTAGMLPVVAAPGAARSFGEIDLPVPSESLPAAVHRDRQLPSVAQPPEILGGAFGEIDLPREAPSSAPPPRRERADSQDFSDLRLEPGPRGGRTPSVPPVREDATGGMTFGEVDLGGAEAARVETSGAPSGGSSVATPRPMVESSVQVDRRTGRRADPLAPRARRKASLVRGVSLSLAVAGLLGGASLQLTPYGAFGYRFASDIVHAGSYAAATTAAVAEAQKMLGAGTYDVAKAAVEAAYEAHARTPRAQSLTAYAALVDFEVTVRFGTDASRASRAKQLVGELPLDAKVPYLDVARAAQVAEGGEMVKARQALDAEGASYSNDPILLDVLRLTGDVDLATRDAAAAVTTFKRALGLSNDARAHFGLARAYDLMGDGVNAKKEIDATLATSPLHAGALTLRARGKSAVAPLDALSDLAIVLTGPARQKASDRELSSAYAAKAWIDLERGGTSDAREAFAQAVKLNPGNVDALNGEGRLFLDEGRYAEALARFDTALKSAPDSPETIANDADAELALERLADAKQQLVSALERFPKNVPILLVLGKVEQRLGNVEAADSDLRKAVADADPLQAGAVLPYVALSELLSARGRLNDAHAILDTASKTLPPSAALERAFGEVSELEGDYDSAIGRYRAAVTKAPKDLAAHFRLAVALRRVSRFEDAAAELDQIGAVDQDYPGLMLERGLLFEESGDVDKAIAQFKEALARAPEDPDLELRVGSAYVAISRPDDALPMLHKVLEMRPASAEALHFIGRALMEKGGSSQADALHYLQRAVAIDPNRAEFHVYLARAANEATPAQLELARDEVDHALALDKLNADAYWQRGVLERIEGAIDDAVKDEKRALELRPSRYEAHATLAECNEDRNDNAAAMAEWSRAIAGDAGVRTPDGDTPHPYWHYRYGKLLIEKGGKAAALVHLVSAVTAAEKMEIRPAWLAPLEFMTAEALRGSGRKPDAIEHYRRFLEIAPVSSPDRADAKLALSSLLPREKQH